ncbi:hypothetical protein RQN9TF_15640 [Rhodococcus qingshengii]|nr:hypothetical protein RQN9TF_15640 [Rhodococcus qingshengii]
MVSTRYRGGAMFLFNPRATLPGADRDNADRHNAVWGWS